MGDVNHLDQATQRLEAQSGPKPQPGSPHHPSMTHKSVPLRWVAQWPVATCPRVEWPSAKLSRPLPFPTENSPRYLIFL